MTTRLFISDPPTDLPATVELEPDESHYLVRVRRRSSGDAVELLDGKGHAWLGSVVAADPRRAVVKLEAAAAERPDVAPLHLLLGMPEPAATLEAIAAACALGAQTVTLLPCARASGKPPGTDRMIRIQRATMRQCGRRTPVEVLAQTLDEAVADAPGERFVAHPTAPAGPPPALEPGATASVLVGPEGGLDEAELARAQEAGFAPLWLGPWTLETPAAVIAALSRLQRG